MLVESGNPAHSLADSARMREALAALELVVVIDVAFSETARLAHYVLPVASQFEKAEATFFNFEFPHNYFHLRKALLAAAARAVLARRSSTRGCARRSARCRTRRSPRCAPRGRTGGRAFRAEVLRAGRREPAPARRSRPSLLYRAIGDLLPRGPRGRRGRLGRCVRSRRSASRSRSRAPASRASPATPPTRSSTRSSQSKSAVVFSRRRLGGELRARAHREQAASSSRSPSSSPSSTSLADEAAPGSSAEFPFVLSAGERRSFTANTIIRNPDWRRKDRVGRAAHEPRRREAARRRRRRRARASRPGAAAPRSRSSSPTACSPATSRCRTGSASTSPTPSGARATTGVAPNELTARRGPRLARGHAVAQAHPGAGGSSMSGQIRTEVDGRVL